MRDLNFFLPLNETKKDSESSNILLYILGGIMGVYLLGTTMWFGFNYFSLNSQISAAQKEIDNEDFKAQYSTAEKVLNKDSIVNEYKNNIANVETIIEGRDLVSTEVIGEVFANIPKEVFITTMNIKENNMELVCTTQNRVSAAEFQNNLIKLGRMENVTISGLESNVSNGSYGFTLKCTLKGVDNDENK